MGDKSEARETAAEAGVPVSPGSDGTCESAREVKRVGAEVGYPLVIKASAGGGGKGMRVVEAEAGVEDAYLNASREAAATFGDGSVYVEKYLRVSGTSRCRCSPTRTARPSFFPRGTAPSSAATRS